MLYVLFNQGEPVAVTTECPYTGTPELKKFTQGYIDLVYDEAKDARDFKSLAEVTEVAEKLTNLTGITYIGFDDGSGTSHRFGVMQLPQVGDDVSFGFNGDYYPCGKIVKITPSLRIYTEDEKRGKHVFFRRKQTSGWLMKGGTWSLVKGTHDERNPSF